MIRIAGTPVQKISRKKAADPKKRTSSKMTVPSTTEGKGKRSMSKKKKGTTTTTGKAMTKTSILGKKRKASSTAEREEKLSRKKGSGKLNKSGKKRKRSTSMVKRPKSAFLYFSGQTRADIKKNNPAATFTECSRITGERWGAATDNDKVPFVDLAKQDKIRYKTEVDNELRPPKKPLNGFFIFTGVERQAVQLANPDFKIGDVQKVLGAMWKALPDKSVYEDSAAANKLRYAQDLLEYNNAVAAAAAVTESTK
jgi:hypothetical protein